MAGTIRTVDIGFARRLAWFRSDVHGRLPRLEPSVYLCDLFTRLAKHIDALMPWAFAARIKASQ
jgi:hypothetical protein